MKQSKQKQMKKAYKKIAIQEAKRNKELWKQLNLDYKTPKTF